METINILKIMSFFYQQKIFKGDIRAINPKGKKLLSCEMKIRELGNLTSEFNF